MPRAALLRRAAGLVVGMVLLVPGLAALDATDDGPSGHHKPASRSPAVAAPAPR